MKIERFEGGPFAQNSWLAICESTQRAVLFDAGAGASEALERCRQLEVELAAVLLTHAHIDHVDGLGPVRDAHPEIPVRIHPKSRPVWDDVPARARQFGLPVPRLPDDVRLDIEDGERIDLGGELVFDVRFAPGHAPGHVVFVHTASGTAFVGDVVFAGSIGRTDLPGGSLEVLMRSIREQILTLPEATALLPGHGPATTVQRERVSNPFLTGSGPGLA